MSTGEMVKQNGMMEEGMFH